MAIVTAFYFLTKLLLIFKWRWMRHFGKKELLKIFLIYVQKYIFFLFGKKRIQRYFGVLWLVKICCKGCNFFYSVAQRKKK